MSQDTILNVKKALISEIRKHPAIWQNVQRTRIDTYSEWADIHDKFTLPIQLLRMYWHTARKTYLSILLEKTKKQDISPSKWILFHEMSFMYEVAKQIIALKLGGLSPPLLVDIASDDGNPRAPCPCCIILPSGAARNLDILLAKQETIIEHSEDQQKDRSSNSLKRSLDISNELPMPVKIKRTSSVGSCFVQREKIIDTIKSYPVLYTNCDSVLKSYHSLVWSMVAKEVGIPMSAVQRRWRALKSRFFKELNAEGNPNAGSFVSDWEHFEQMSFMRDQLQPIRVKDEQQCIQIVDLSSDESVETIQGDLEHDIQHTTSGKIVQEQSAVNDRELKSDGGDIKIEYLDVNKEKEDDTDEDQDFTNEEGEDLEFSSEKEEDSDEDNTTNQNAKNAMQQKSVETILGDLDHAIQHTASGKIDWDDLPPDVQDQSAANYTDHTCEGEDIKIEYLDPNSDEEADKDKDEDQDFTIEEEDQDFTMEEGEELEFISDDDDFTREVEDNNVKDPDLTNKVKAPELSSEEEDGNLNKHIYVCNDCEETMTSNSSGEVYERELIYFAEEIRDDIICLDDDEQSN